MQDLKGFTEADQELKSEFMRLTKRSKNKDLSIKERRKFKKLITKEMRFAYNKYMRLYRKSTPLRHSLAMDRSANWKIINFEQNEKTSKLYCTNNREAINTYQREYAKR